MLMLLKLLKLFGLDVPAKRESGERGRDVCFEHAKDNFTRMAVQAAVIAEGVALIALYQWTSEDAGLHAGLGAGRHPNCAGNH
jgi:hypothetical protein